MAVVYKCKMCGGDLSVQAGKTVCECEYCGAKQTVSSVDDEIIVNLFNRANNLRIKSEFDKAQEIYEKIVSKKPNESEAYWGIVLCKYGIEYVEDPSTFNRVPTCHRTQIESVLTDVDYISAIENADDFQTAIYVKEAKSIDKLQKNILSIVEKEEPFDVFICYKESDENGKRTVDSVIANDIYYQLTQEGFKVFYSAITLEDKIGQEYEPYIFSALNSAKVMLVIGTKPEYFNAVWVKNEWSRYLKIVKSDRSKLLIPCYRDMDAYDLPEEFSHLQAQDMSKIGFINDVTRGIRKVLSSESNTISNNVQTSESSQNIAPLLERAFMFLEDGDWTSADEYCERVLDQDPKNAQAYIAKLMAELHVHKKSDLEHCSDTFENSLNYQKIIKYADDTTVNELQSYISCIKSNQNDLYDSLIIKMQNSESAEEYRELSKLFDSIISFKDSRDKKEECLMKADEASQKERVYYNAKKFVLVGMSIGSEVLTTDIRALENSINMLNSIKDYSDVNEFILKCKKQIEWINNDYGELKLVFSKSMNKNDFSILIDETIYKIGKVNKNDEKIIKLHSGTHQIIVDNNVNYQISICIERDKTTAVSVSKSVFGDFSIKEI